MDNARAEYLATIYGQWFEAERNRVLAPLRESISEAVIFGSSGGELTTLRANYSAVKDLALPTGTHAEIVAAWPAAFAPLPEFLADPEAADAKDPPGEPCTVDLNPVLPVEEELPLDLTLEAQILATRAEKAKGENAARDAGPSTGREMTAEDLAGDDIK